MTGSPNSYTAKEEARIDRINERIAVLKSRIATSHRAHTHHERAEVSALEWALSEIERLQAMVLRVAESYEATQCGPNRAPASWNHPMTVTDAMLAAAKQAEPKVGRDAVLRIYKAMQNARSDATRGET